MSNYTISDLASFIKQQKEKGQPFVLFTGAGCSKTAGIPLASEFVKEINEKYSLEIKGLSEQNQKDYGQCMNVIGKDERRKLIKGYIDKAKINWTHLVIAILVQQGLIKRVMTFNFDNLLARSCGLLGLYPATYDFTATNLDLQDLIVDPAIVHLHGQSHGFNLLNSYDETSQHAEALSNFINSTLNASPAIFIGYSGQADAFFPTLASKYRGQHRLFWCDRGEEANPEINQALLNKHGVAHYIQAADSDEFFIQLARELDCFPPTLISDPYAHLLHELEEVMPFPIQKDSEQDLLAKVKSDLKEAQKLHKSSDASHIEQLLTEGKYDKVIKLSESKPSVLKDNPELISWAFFGKANDYADHYTETGKEKLLHLSLNSYSKAAEISPYHSSCFNNWGNALAKHAKLTQQTTDYEACFDKYEKATVLEPDKDLTYRNWGIALTDYAKLTQLTEDHEASFEKFEKAIALKPDNDSTYRNWGIALANYAKLTQQAEDHEASFKKFEKAIALKSDHSSNYYNYGAALSERAKIAKSEAEKTKYLSHSTDILLKAETINPADVFNLACSYSLLNEVDKCKEKLLICEGAGTLPGKAHLESDDDLDNVRNKEWFKQLLVRIK